VVPFTDLGFPPLEAKSADLKDLAPTPVAPTERSLPPASDAKPATTSLADLSFPPLDLKLSAAPTDQGPPPVDTEKPAAPSTDLSVPVLVA